MSDINNIAIALTQKIEQAIVYEFAAEKGKRSPSYYNIRETILRTLREYIEIYSSSVVGSPRELEQMPKNILEDYMHHKKKVAGAQLAEAVLENTDITKRWAYSDEFSRNRTINVTLPVIKLNKLINDTDDDYLKGRF